MCKGAEEKRALRVYAKKNRETLSNEARNAAIFETFFRSPYAAAERIFLYLSVGSEASTRAIAEELLRRGKRVLAPRIVAGVMRAVPYTGETKEGAFKIPEPPSGEDEPCDVALAPLLLFDGTGSRLGYGGGYYDAYFSAHPEVLRVGLAYAGQAAEALPCGAHDVRLDALVTEEGVRVFPPRND